MSYRTVDRTAQVALDVADGVDCDFRRKTLLGPTWGAWGLARRLSRWVITTDGRVVPKDDWREWLRLAKDGIIHSLSRW